MGKNSPARLVISRTTELSTKETRRCETVYLGVDVLGVCEVFYAY